MWDLQWTLQHLYTLSLSPTLPNISPRLSIIRRWTIGPLNTAVLHLVSITTAIKRFSVTLSFVLICEVKTCLCVLSAIQYVLANVAENKCSRYFFLTTQEPITGNNILGKAKLVPSRPRRHTTRVEV
jgi:hypothetical protein